VWFGREEKTMDCVTMVLMAREMGFPLDLVILINSFVYEKLSNDNFEEALYSWFWSDSDGVLVRFGHISDWNTSRITDMTFEGDIDMVYFEEEDTCRWNLGNVTRMSESLYQVLKYNKTLKWD
jgi:hypothetical protein